MEPKERKERLELCNKLMEKVWLGDQIIKHTIWLKNEQFYWLTWLFCFVVLKQEELLKFQANLKRQLELIRMNSRPPPPPPAANNMQPPPPSGANMPMPMSAVPVSMPIPSAPPYDRQNSNSSTSGNDDGWVLVPSQAESDAWYMQINWMSHHEHLDDDNCGFLKCKSCCFHQLNATRSIGSTHSLNWN